ncbi:MAG: hypothetical protein KY453_04780 [Gemmatimonadetes bacterium]|nr:hypothetical protein [Gemmatimonadota bacterium]
MIHRPEDRVPAISPRLALRIAVLGFVALAISIVGILAIPFWAVLFPLAVALAIALGYVAVAQILGEWVAQQRYQRLDWVRAGNPYSTVVAGVGALMVAFMLSNVLEMAGPWTGVFQGILVFLGVLATLAAAITGFGAVLLTRGGRRAEYGGFGDWDLDLKSAAPPPPASDGFGTGGSRSGPSSGAREAGAAEGPRPGRVPESGDAGEPRPERPHHASSLVIARSVTPSAPTLPYRSLRAARYYEHEPR